MKHLHAAKQPAQLPGKRAPTVDKSGQGTSPGKNGLQPTTLPDGPLRKQALPSPGGTGSSRTDKRAGSLPPARFASPPARSFDFRLRALRLTRCWHLWETACPEYGPGAQALGRLKPELHHVRRNACEDSCGASGNRDPWRAALRAALSSGAARAQGHCTARSRRLTPQSLFLLEP